MNMELKDAMKELAKLYRTIYKYGVGRANFENDKERDIQLWKWQIQIDELKLAIKKELPIPTYVQVPDLKDWALKDLIEVYEALGFEFWDHTRVDDMVGDLLCSEMGEDEEG